MSVSIKSRKLTTAQLKRMSGKQLASRGYIRISGFTKSDGTKVKTHVRKLNPSEKKMSDVKAAKEVAGNVIDFVPVIGDAKAFKDAGDAFSVGDRFAGVILVGAGAVGLVPLVGDIAAKPLKAIAKTFKKEVGTVGKSMHDEAMEQVARGGELFAKGPIPAHTPPRIPSSKLVETTKQKAVRMDLYKQEDKINLKINKLLNPNYGATGDLASPLVKVKYNKLDAQRKVVQSARDTADKLAYGGKSSKELKEAKRIYEAADSKNKKILLKSRKLRAQMKTTTNPTVRAAIKRKQTKLLADREKLFNTKEYFDARKIVTINDLL